MGGLREIYRLAIAAVVVTSVTVLRILDKVDNSLLASIIFTIIGYYFGRAEPLIVRALKRRR